MNDDDQKRESGVGNRITNLIRSIGQGPEKPVAVEEQRKLAAAAARLDQILKEAADADRQALRNAAGRLDELLSDMHKGQDITDRVKRRSRKPKETSIGAAQPE
jgi:hypothetical protein